MIGSTGLPVPYGTGSGLTHFVNKSTPLGGVRDLGFAIDYAF